jgi:O-methyltransferase involved in polyketide biosynthesis
MSGIKYVAGTAFVVAEFRAEENSEPSPLYRDPVAGLFLNEDTRETARASDDVASLRLLLSVHADTPGGSCLMNLPLVPRCERASRRIDQSF